MPDSYIGIGQMLKLIQNSGLQLDANVHKVFDIKFGSIKERLQPTIDGGYVICALGFELNFEYLHLMEIWNGVSGVYPQILTKLFMKNKMIQNQNSKT